MFNPLGFYRLAVKLVKSRPPQAEGRTATSRAYYACFLTARAYTGQDAARGPEVHRRVIIELHRMNRSDLATRLQALRGIRNEADYNTARAFTATEAHEAIDGAATIVKVMRRT
jgi:uncharacterized protein (UPF0332 family)